MDIDNIVYDVFRKAATNAIHQVKQQLLDDADEVIDAFYNDYTPLFYWRVNNLRRSYKARVLEAGKSKNSQLSRSAVLTFSPDYMPEDYHAVYNGGTEYDKNAVMYYDFGNGWHGAPYGNFATMRKLRPSPEARMNLCMKKYEGDSGFLSNTMDAAFEQACQTIRKEIDKTLK